MKKIFMLILFTELLCAPILTFAQENHTSKYHEFGITFSSLDNFGLRYKFGSEKTMLRLSLLSMNLSTLNTSTDRSQTGTNKTTGYGAGIGIGVDHKISLYKNLSLLLGGELGLSYTYNHMTLYSDNDSLTTEYKQMTLSPRVSFIFGINYIVKEHLILGAEINPTLSYTLRSDKRLSPEQYTSNTNIFGFSLTTAGAGLYIAYRFGK